MNEPWVPPYFGSWEKLVHQLLNNPFLGSGHSGPGHRTWRVEDAAPSPERAADPEPNPWIVYLCTLKVAAATLPEGPSKSEFESRIGQAISAFLDDYCGTRYRPWPWPGPPPWALTTASELTLVANTLQEGKLRNELVQVVSQIMQRAVALNPQPLPPGHHESR